MDITSEKGFAPDGHRPDHPYYPLSLSMPHYVPNTLPVWQLFAYFLSALGGFIAVLFIAACCIKPRFRSASFSDKALFVWFTLCES